VAEAVDQLNLADTHALRKSGAARAAQVTRGKDTAWRRDIDHEFHLHYWESEDGGIELASVVPHNCFDILV
jgi:hypothetical protein